MLIKLSCDRLPYFLCKRGPYVLYFNAECSAINQKLVEYMHKIDTVYNEINLFEVRWVDYKIFQYIRPDKMMNFVYVYYNGYLNFSQNLNENLDLNNLFEKVVDLYNDSIDKAILNVGIKLDIHSNEENQSKTQYPSRKREYTLNYRRKKLLSKKIKFSKDKMPPEILLYSVEKSDIWFTDVKCPELPYDIFEDNTKVESSKDKDIKNKYFKKCEYMTETINLNNTSVNKTFNTYKSTLKNPKNMSHSYTILVTNRNKSIGDTRKLQYILPKRIISESMIDVYEKDSSVLTMQDKKIKFENLNKTFQNISNRIIDEKSHLTLKNSDEFLSNKNMTMLKKYEKNIKSKISSSKHSKIPKFLYLIKKCRNNPGQVIPKISTNILSRNVNNK